MFVGKGICSDLAPRILAQKMGVEALKSDRSKKRETTDILSVLKFLKAIDKKIYIWNTKHLSDFRLIAISAVRLKHHSIRLY